AEGGRGKVGGGGVFGEDEGGGLEIGDEGDIGDVADDEVGRGLCGEFLNEGLVLCGEDGGGGHRRGGPGEIGNEGVVIADPEEDGGGLGLDGEGGLTIDLSVAEAGEAEDELVDLLLAGGGVDEGDGVGDVVD